MLLAMLLLPGCDRAMSFEDARALPEYRGLNDADARWLYDHHMTRRGALGWLDDEIRFRDTTLEVWFTSEGTVSLETYTGRYEIDTDKAVKMVQAQGGAAAARELITAARKKTGGDSKPQEPRILTPGMTRDERRAQELRYPVLWKEYVIWATQESLKKAQEQMDAGNPVMAFVYIQPALNRRRLALGDDHEATKFLALWYTRISGQEPPAEPAPDSDILMMDAYIEAARTYWQNGQRQAAYNVLGVAFLAGTEVLPRDHEKIKEVERIMEKMAPE